jgi:hypothetical protein
MLAMLCTALLDTYSGRQCYLTNSIIKRSKPPEALNFLYILRPMSAQASEIGLGVTELQGRSQGQGSGPLNPFSPHVTASDG